jgi:hypothetical protein
MTIHNIALVESDDDYTPRWVQPRHAVAGLEASVVLRGNFKHNRHAPFEVVIFDTPELFRSWHTGKFDTFRGPEEGIGDLSAQATIISSPPQAVRTVINVEAGDILRTVIGDYEIRDDWGLHDPYLVKVA